MYVEIPDDLAERTENLQRDLETFSDVEIRDVLTQYLGAVRQAERIEADRKELEKYSKPMVPLDVPIEVWKAASAHYVDTQWTPAPNHHPEYRDVRAAFIATVRWALRELDGWDDPEFPLRETLRERGVTVEPTGGEDD